MDRGTENATVVIASFLTPSRSRPTLLRRSVSSVLDRADDAAEVEILVGVDPDDQETLDTVLRLNHPCVVPYVMPERFGYPQFHLYFNALARSAEGDWLILWNDDAIMVTGGFETKMSAYPPGVLGIQTNHGQFNVFPAVHRKAHEAMGHYSLHRANDSWVTDVANGAGCFYPAMDIHAFHDRYDLTGNNYDDIYLATSAQYDTANYYGPEMSTLRAEDIEKVRAALNA